MVATQAFGQAVVADAPTPSPITSASDTPILWEQTRTLTLADGSTAYGCAHCDYTSRNVNSIRPHLRKHNRRTNNQGNGQLTGHGPAAELTVHELLTQLAVLEELRADRNAWKARAVKAEKALRTLRKVLGGDT
jgi:hypothetical protein